MHLLLTLKNSIYAIFSYIILASLALIVRKVFLNYFSLDLLGYESFFINIFAVFSIADLGVESLILYRLFPCYRDNDWNRINIIMAIYKRIYFYIAIFIVFISLLFSFFIDQFVKNTNVSLSLVYFIFVCQLINILSIYVLAYKRILFSISLKDYVCTKIDTSVGIVFNAIKLFVVYVFNDYILYLLCGVLLNIISNIIISFKAHQNFSSYVSTVKISFREELAKFGIIKDIKNNLYQRISLTIYGGTDNIIISLILGMAYTGKYANYILLQSFIVAFFVKVLKPFQMLIGNIVNSVRLHRGYIYFRLFDLFSFAVALVITAEFVTSFTSVINIWLGEGYLLSYEFILALSINQYIMWNHCFLCYYRYAFGKYELDKYPTIFAAISNIVISVVLCKYYDITGVVIGTVIGHLGFWYGRLIVVYKEYIHERIRYYLFRQIYRLGILVLTLVSVKYIFNCTQYSLYSLILVIFLVPFFSLLVLFIFYCNSFEFKYLYRKFRRIKNK